MCGKIISGLGTSLIITPSYSIIPLLYKND